MPVQLCERLLLHVCGRLTLNLLVLHKPKRGDAANSYPEINIAWLFTVVLQLLAQ